MNDLIVKRGPESGLGISADDVDAREFWWNVDISGECWLWTGGHSSGGYGTFYSGGKSYRAHRVAYALANGATPAGLTVRHGCDNPTCVRPEHLEIGTQAENVIDRDSRGRRRPPKGEANGNAALTWAAVEEIRAAHASGLNQCQIARQVGVHRTTVGRVVRGEAWL